MEVSGELCRQAWVSHTGPGKGGPSSSELALAWSVCPTKTLPMAACPAGPAVAELAQGLGEGLRTRGAPVIAASGPERCECG